MSLFLIWRNSYKKHYVFIDAGFLSKLCKYLGDGKYDTSQPILADWGRRVLGLSEKEMIKMGGMKVKNTGTGAFEQGLIHLQHVHRKIFEDTFKENMK